MKEQQLTWKMEPPVELPIQPSNNLASCGGLDGNRRLNYRVSRQPFPRVRRESCEVTTPAMLAALRKAEFAEWQASGGDFMRSV